MMKEKNTPAKPGRPDLESGSVIGKRIRPVIPGKTSSLGRQGNGKVMFSIIKNHFIKAFWVGGRLRIERRGGVCEIAKVVSIGNSFQIPVDKQRIPILPVPFPELIGDGVLLGLRSI